jgi:cytochrome b
MSAATEVKVWDPFVRLFHWSLVATFAFAYLTGESESRWHEWLGYAVLALVAARGLWGLVGTRHARFSDFVRGPRALFDYAAEMLRGRPRRFLGHNPLGGAMVVALLVALAATGASGYAIRTESGALRAAAPAVSLPVLIATARADETATAPSMARGPRLDPIGDENEEEREGGEWLGETHEFFAHLTLILIALHLAGVALTSWQHRENLVRAMFTGRKRG